MKYETMQCGICGSLVIYISTHDNSVTCAGCKIKSELEQQPEYDSYEEQPQVDLYAMIRKATSAQKKAKSRQNENTIL